MHSFGLRSAVLLIAMALPMVCANPCALAQVPTANAIAKSGILSRDEAARLLPTSVFFAGRSATVQARNSTGFRFDSGKLVLACLVDTSGYSTGLQEKYQFYLIVETPLEIGGQMLGVGAYGAGFIGKQFVVMNIAGDTVLTAVSKRDAVITRPTPLQILSGLQSGSFRLYAGRDFIEISGHAGSE